LERAKQEALVLIDAAATTQTCASSCVFKLPKTPVRGASNLKRLLSLSQLITLNTGLQQNLKSTNPRFAFNKNGYTA
jgi:hypothetical protein